MFMVPFYSWLTTRLRPLKLVAVCNVTLILLIEAFSVIEFTSASLSQTLHIGFAFYIFVGIYGLFSVSQVRGGRGGGGVCVWEWEGSQFQATQEMGGGVQKNVRAS